MTSGLQGNALAKNAIQTHKCARAHTHTHTHTLQVCQTHDDYPKTHMGKHAVQTDNKQTHYSDNLTQIKIYAQSTCTNSIQTTKHENIPQMQRDFLTHFHMRNQRLNHEMPHLILYPMCATLMRTQHTYM